MQSGDHQKSARENEAAIVMAFYKFASEPENWDQILDIIGKADEEALDILKGHLDQAAELSQKIFNGFLDNELHDTDYGILEIDSHNIICASNRTARTLLYDHLSSTLNEDDLCFRDEDHQQIFLDARARLARGDVHSTLLRFDLRDEKTTLLAVLMSNPEDESLEPEKKRQRAKRLRLVFSPISLSTDNGEILRTELGLTHSEARLALHLGTGATVAEAAEELNISIHTARNQLKAIYAKTGLKRQSELIKLLIELGLLSRILIDQRHTWTGPNGQRDAVALEPRKYYILPDGRKLAYRLYGKPDGHPLLAFHSGLASIIPLMSQSAQIARAGLALYVIERPGFGMSDAARNYSFDSVTQDVADFVDGKGFNRLSIMAEASGTAFALSAALRLDGKVCSTTLTAAVPEMPIDMGDRNANFFKYFYHRINQNPWALKGFWRIFRNGYNYKMGRSLITEFYPPGSADRHFSEIPLIEEQLIHNTRESLVRTSEGVATEMIFRAGKPRIDISKLKTPLIVWHGREDTHFSVEDITDYANTAPEAHIRICEDIGHTVMFKYWGDIMEDISGFVHRSQTP
jgi:pimeloyl-ACP methyl ester carboxylesterase/DNA-binding CsgD family transcriptional regulator